MAKTSTMVLQYARMGALTRLTELRMEIDAIEHAFPDLANRRGPRRGRSALSAASYPEHGWTAGPEAPVARRRTRKPMTSAQRKAVGERMRRYWAARKSVKK